MISWGGQDAKRLGRPNVHCRKATMNWGAEQLHNFLGNSQQFPMKQDITYTGNE